MNTNTVLFTDTRFVIMTSDKKCILRGNSKYNMTLCLVNEPSRLKVKVNRNGKAVLTSVKSSVNRSWANVKLSDAVKELYNTKDSFYNEEKIGELITVRVSAEYRIKD